MKKQNQNPAAQITLKALMIAGMILIMLIPVAMLQSMIEERMEYRQEVEHEIGSSWGGPQTVTGPILALPYETGRLKDGKPTTVQGTAYFLPETLHFDGKVDTEVRARTAYKVLLYQSKLELNGEFSHPDLLSLGLSSEDIRWKEAYLYIGISHLQGVQSRMRVEWDGRKYEHAQPTSNQELAGSGFAVRLDLEPLSGNTENKAIPFQFGMDLNGTGNLFFTPVGKETTAAIQSSWETVSFAGNYLPASRELENGFSATWKIFDFNRSYPQAWLDGRYKLPADYLRYGTRADSTPLLQSASGVDLRFPLDYYQLSMRSVKYALMFIALTFFVFFLVELISQRRIHPIQYLLVSFGLVLFYSLLLALSEHIGFDWAYLVSALAIIGLITAYSGSIFKNRKQTIRMGAFLTALYLYLYVMLQLEDMALLFGSVGLFVALAVIMYASRKVSWYKNGNQLVSVSENVLSQPNTVIKNDADTKPDGLV